MSISISVVLPSNILVDGHEEISIQSELDILEQWIKSLEPSLDELEERLNRDPKTVSERLAAFLQEGLDICNRVEEFVEKLVPSLKDSIPTEEFEKLKGDIVNLVRRNQKREHKMVIVCCSSSFFPS